ncbi:MAG: hypothetical protein JWM25_813 [Thermoleophilia bacterium]|nr:hypothetical protein [Thermoleophilia bacterium]MCZ4496230.1 hypothetical protein [Thermoleophilia bacterium]
MRDDVSEIDQEFEARGMWGLPAVVSHVLMVVGMVISACALAVVLVESRAEGCICLGTLAATYVGMPLGLLFVASGLVLALGSVWNMTRRVGLTVLAADVACLAWLWNS